MFYILAVTKYGAVSTFQADDYKSARRLFTATANDPQNSFVQWGGIGAGLVVARAMIEVATGMTMDYPVVKPSETGDSITLIPGGEDEDEIAPEDNGEGPRFNDADMQAAYERSLKERGEE